MDACDCNRSIPSYFDGDVLSIRCILGWRFYKNEIHPVELLPRYAIFESVEVERLMTDSNNGH